MIMNELYMLNDKRNVTFYKTAFLLTEVCYNESWAPFMIDKQHSLLTKVCNFFFFFFSNAVNSN
jgi:hypothetical protein